METKSNYVIVGIFTILSVLAAFGFVYWTAGLGDQGETVELRFRIPGSAAGLGRGSFVLFNGVKVGDVKRVYLDPQNPTVAIADTLVLRWTPVKPSTRADVGIAGLTGQANIELTGGSPTEPNLLEQAEEQGQIPVIEATPSALANLLQATQGLMTRAEGAVSQLEGLVSDARQPLTSTLENVERFTKALGDNAGNIDDFLGNVGELSKAISQVSGRLDGTLEAVDGLVRSVNPEQIKEIVSEVRTFTGQLSEAGTRLDGITENVDGAVASIRTFSDNAGKTLERIDQVVATVDPEAVGTAVKNFTDASSAVDRAAGQIAKVSETIGSREQDIDQFITDAKELAARLNQASTRVDSVLVKIDGMLGSDDAGGLMADARETLAAFRKVADTLNARMGTITDGLARFSGQGLRDIESLATDARRSINRIERAISDFEQNPQRVITGGDGAVRRYDGRARH